MIDDIDDINSIDAAHAIPGDEKVVAPEPVVEEQVEVLDEALDVEVEETVAETPEEPVQSEPSLEDRLQAQQELIDRLLAGKPLVDVPEGYTPPPAPVAPTPAPPAPTPQLVSDEMYDELMSDPKKFNDFMATVLKSTREQAVAEAYSLALQNIPQVMEPSIHEAARNQLEVNSWMQANPILAQHQQATATILNQVDAFHPQLSLTEKLQMTLNTLNSHLGTNPQRTAGNIRPTSGVQRPAFAAAPRGALPAATKTGGLQAELDALTL